jgi:molecular chaperone GrpE (heat shock protein)
MSQKRQVWETFSQLAQRLLAAADADAPAPPAGSGEVTQELKRLGKAQFKANALQEATLDQLRQAVDQLAAREQETQQQSQAQARHDLLTALLPVLDGLDAALGSGERLLAHPAEGREERWLVRQLKDEKRDGEEATRLALQSDRALMAAWLDGLRLVRQRLLALLAEAGVEPIPTVGQPFDPYLHQAIGTANDGAHPPGTVIAEQRRGYTGPGGVLRYAEVIVNRASKDSNVGSPISNNEFTNARNDL